MNPFEQLETVLDKIESQTKITDILIKEALSVCDNAINWYEQQIAELGDNDGQAA